MLKESVSRMNEPDGEGSMKSKKYLEMVRERERETRYQLITDKRASVDVDTGN